MQVVPVESQLEDAGEDMEVILFPHSFTSFDLSIESPNLRMPGAGTDSVRKSLN